MLPAGARAADHWPAAEQAIPISPRRAISGLSMRNAQGEEVTLADFKGQCVVLNLWATWCVPCRREMPALSRLARMTEGANIAILPLCFDPNGAEAAAAFYAEFGIGNLPVLTGDAGNLKRALSVAGLPSTLVIDPSGLHAATVIGEAVWDDAATAAWLRRLAKS